MILVSIAFQRHIASPIWAMFVKVQPDTWGSSSATAAADYVVIRILFSSHVNHDPRENPPMREIPI